jgi:multiple sugar transport system permease protein
MTVAQSEQGSGTRRRKQLTLSAREARLAYLLVVPGVLLVFLIILFPMVWNIVLSFRPIRFADLADLNLLDFGDLNLENYRDAFGARFVDALQVTLIYTVASTVLAIVLGLWAALVAKEKFRGSGAFRAFILFPYIAPVVSTAFIWRLMLNKNYGIVNAALGLEGREAIGWLTSRSAEVPFMGGAELPVALMTVIGFEAWRYFPFAFLFILARLQAIPTDMYEAAQIDGASPTQQFWYVTLPQLRTVVATLFILRFIWTFYKFEDIFLLNGGAAGTEVLTVQIFNWLFSRRDIGVAAALGVGLASVLTIFVFAYQRRVETEED